jgi:acetyltransferase-like isoleucine patch superfamily enzyme
VEIGDNSWVGANTIILRGTKIGKNCVVGAGCVISGEYPDNSIITQKRETISRSV